MRAAWHRLGDRRWLSAAVVVAVILAGAIAVVLGAWVLSRYASGTPILGHDPWPTAIEQTQALLQDSPDFERHMLAYRAAPDELDRYLTILESARPASAALDQLHKLDLPLVGNAWQLLVSALNAVRPGSGDAVDQLDMALKQVVGFRGKIAALSDADAVGIAVQRFRASPSKQTLRALRDSCVYYGGVVRDVDTDMQLYLITVSGAVGKVNNIQQGLLQAQDTLGRVAPLRDFVGGLNKTVSDMAEPLRSLHATVIRLDNQMQSDLATMRSIEEIAASAENPRAAAAPTSTKR
jgi:hypothetical protein